MSQKSALFILFIIVLIMTLLVGCRSSKLSTATPDHKAIQTKAIPQETGTASYYQTKAQFLAQATADSAGGGSGSEDFPYAPCVISAFVVAAVVGIFARSRSRK
jgi:hypothetical protein